MIRLDTKGDIIKEHEEQLPEMRDAFDNLQGNILRGHGRKNSVNLFLRFQAGKETTVRQLIRGLAEDGTITSALKQSEQSKNRKRINSLFFCSFFLSAEGHKYLYPNLYPYVLTKFSREFQGA